MTCSIPVCNKPVHARGWCGAHYTRWRKFGDPLGVAPSVSVVDRFWAKVQKSAEPDGCWIWTASRTSHGYGKIGVNGRLAAAHRLSFELSKGPIPAGMQVDHVCFNRGCVNPAHLRLATNKQNNEHRSGARRDSSSGVRGVYWHSRAKRWQASTRHNGRTIHLGLFDTLAEADVAVRAKRRELFTHSDMDRRAS
jgi:hypothetical protein